MTFEANPSINSELAEHPAVKSAALDAAQAIAAEAIRTAPVGETEAYKDGIRAQETKHGARVIASAPESAYIEFGVPAHGIPATFNLRRAAISLGYKFKKMRD